MKSEYQTYIAGRLKSAKAAHVQAKRAAHKQYKVEIAPFQAQIAAYLQEMAAASAELKRTQEEAQTKFMALPGATQFIHRYNRGADEVGALADACQEFFNTSRQAKRNCDARCRAAEETFALPTSNVMSRLSEGSTAR